jgi:hypothetical protein
MPFKDMLFDETVLKFIIYFVQCTRALSIAKISLYINVLGNSEITIASRPL